MGRASIEHNRTFQQLKIALENSAQKLESENRKLETCRENLASQIRLQNARAVVAAKEDGLSDYAIGLASGRTSHRARLAYIKEAYDLVEKYDEVEAN